MSEGEAGDEREELIAYNACGVCLSALWCVLCVWCRVAGALYGVHACVMWGRV